MTRCASSRSWLSALVLALVAATAASAQSTPTEQKEPSTPITAPTSLNPAALPPPEGNVVKLGPTREIKLADNTWVRFGFQVQAWFKAGQDRILQANGSDGGYSFDFSCRRCRLFATGSVVKDVNFNILFEAGNLGSANAPPSATGAKNSPVPSMLDAYAQVRFADFFYLSGGSILLPLTRNGTQPTTTYLSIDNANVDTTPVGQGNTNVLRDLGFLANGFLLADHLEYHLGVFQGTRAPAKTTQSAGHNPPRVVAALQYNLWDTEKGYVNGGHYYGAKKVLGAVGSFDYQAARTADALPPPAAPGAGAGIPKDPYVGLSGAVFINYPLSGAPDPKRGGDELVGLLQVGYYDGGSKPAPTANPGTYPAVLRQINFLAEGAYYNASLKFSVFGKYEMRKLDSMYPAATIALGNQTWIAGGLKYYVAPANLMNFAIQYERIQFPDALATQQGGTNNVTLQMQLLLY